MKSDENNDDLVRVHGDYNQDEDNPQEPAKIKVAVRMRPLLSEEASRGFTHIGKQLQLDATSIQVAIDRQTVAQMQDVHTHSATVKTFSFDHVFGEEEGQAMLFKQANVEFYVKKVVAGFHSTIFAYGQTGSGKTYTMEGYKYVVNPRKPESMMPHVPESPGKVSHCEEGLIPRCIRSLFEQVDEKRSQLGSSNKIAVTCQYIQLYKEKVYDLLNTDLYKVQESRRTMDGVPSLKIRVGANDEPQIENVYQFECNTAADGFKYFWKGLRNKVMASHRVNDNSSRSHCILTFIVSQVDAKDPENVIISKLQLVDLAGSERQSHVELKGQMRDPAQLKEAIEINKSLFTLRQVITALTENNKINY